MHGHKLLDIMLSSGHPVDYPGQLAPLPVVPVVVEQLGDGQDDQEGERPQHRLPPLRLLRPRAQHGGADVHQLKHDTGHNVYTSVSNPDIGAIIGSLIMPRVS